MVGSLWDISRARCRASWVDCASGTRASEKSGVSTIHDLTLLTLVMLQRETPVANGVRRCVLPVVNVASGNGNTGNT